MDKIQNILVFIFVAGFIVGSIFLLHKASKLEAHETNKDK